MTPSRGPASAVPRALGGLGAALSWTARLFSSSLQLRVITSTIILTCLAFYGVGAFMTQQIARGLYETKLSSVSELTQRYGERLEAIPGGGGTTGADVTERISTELKAMVQGTPVPLRAVFLRPTGGGIGVPQLSEHVIDQPRVADSALTAELIAAVGTAENGTVAHQSIALPSDGGEPTPGLVVGQRVSISDTGQFDLYVVADLSQESSTLDFTERVLLVAAIVLLVLIGAIAWTVARLVVNPVRVAAEVAQRLSDGDLEQRMPVRGRDEIATLGRSFNDMASNLQDQFTRMEQLSVVQRQFVSDVSHELRTPLATIRMASEMIYLSREDLDAASARSAELLHSQVDRFEQLLADLLEISRYDAGAADLDPKPTDLSEVIAGVVETVRLLAGAEGSEIRVHQPSGPIMVDLDRVRIQRITRNLLVNALEHGEDEPIDVHLAADADAAALSVRDHGVGLSPEAVEHVFDRFWRADPARRRTLGGSGLGLAISLEDAHLHGGWLQAWGREGDGACFRLTLPRRSGHEIGSSPLPLPPSDAVVLAGQTDLVAGPVSSDGSVRLHTGSLPIVIEQEPEES